MSDILYWEHKLRWMEPTACGPDFQSSRHPIYLLRFQAVTAARMKVTVCWDIPACPRRLSSPACFGCSNPEQLKYRLEVTALPVRGCNRDAILKCTGSLYAAYEDQ